MKYILSILLFIVGYNSYAQTNPSGNPSQNIAGWITNDYTVPRLGSIVPVNTPTFTPRFPGTAILYQNAGVDTTIYFWAGGRWIKINPTGTDTTSLSNRINLKLNITDTTNKWWGVGKRWVDTVYRKNDSTVGFTINNGAEQTFQILGGSHGSSSGVTSVGLSMPSAFSVTPSTITSSGTFNVSGAGTTAQYIRGNGTLATTDTGMIPNFYLKVRGLLSGSSPITYNSTTGAIGIPYGNITGTKGAVSFNSGSFLDDGSGLISLNQPVPSGPCTNCNITWGSDGRPTAYANGSGGGGGVSSLGPIGATPNANGATITGSVLNLEPTNGAFGGVLNTDTQTVKGSKSFISLHNTISKFSARLNSQWFPSDKTPDSIINGKYQGFGSTDIFPTGTLVTVYSQGDNHVLNNGNILMKKSHDNGATWTTDTIVSNSPGVFVPIMGAAGVTQTGRLLVFYVKILGASFLSMEMIYSDDEGATFSSPQTISNAGLDIYEPYGPLVKIGGDSVLFTWYGYNNAGTNYVSHVIKSGDDGLTWTSPITIIANGTDKYTETSCVYLGGNTIIAMCRSEVNLHLYGQFISYDNGNTWTSQGTTTWGVSATPTWVKSYAGVNGRREVVAYYRAGVLGAFEERAIYGYAQDLINNGPSGWDLNSEVKLADSLNGSGYINIVHPYDNAYGIGWYYDEIVPQSDATIKFLVLPKTPAIPIKQSFASDVVLDDLAGNGTGVVGIDNNGKLSFNAGGSGFQWIQSGSNVYRLNGVGIGAAPAAGYDLHINKTSDASIWIKSGTSSGNSAYMLIGENDATGYSQILRFTNASSNNGLLNINNLNKEISISTQFSGGFVKNIDINAAGGVGIQNRAAVGGDFHVNKLVGDVNAYFTAQATSGHLVDLILGEDTAFSNGTYAQILRYSNASAGNFHPGDLMLFNNGDTITLSTNYSGGQRSDLQVLSSGKIRFNNAYQFPNTIGSSGQSLRVPVSGDELEWYTPSGSTTLYSGDGTLAGNRTVTGGSNSLTFDGIFNFRVNANTFLLAKSTPGAVYTTGVIGSGNLYQLAYTPTPTVYGKGIAIIIDTNNNAGLGSSMPITAPLYSTGLNGFASNLLVGGSIFEYVINVTSNVTLDLTKHYVRIDATSGNVTVTLPAASTAFGSSMGIHYIFKRLDNSGNTITVSRAGSDTIDGGTSFTLTTQYEVKELQCSSTSTWDIR